MAFKINIPAPKDEPQENTIEVDDKTIKVNFNSPLVIVLFLLGIASCIALAIAVFSS